MNTTIALDSLLSPALNFGKHFLFIHLRVEMEYTILSYGIICHANICNIFGGKQGHIFSWDNNHWNFDFVCKPNGSSSFKLSAKLNKLEY